MSALVREDWSDTDLDRLLAELGADSRPLALLMEQAQQDLSGAMAAGDESQARILARTQSWLRVLQREEMNLDAILAALHDACRGSLDSPERDVIEKLRWTVAGLEGHIESTGPLEAAANAVFHVRWTDGSGWWESGSTVTGLQPLGAVIADCAEADGGFTREESQKIAAAALGLLEHGGWSLPNLIRSGASGNESLFRLRERGEASLHAKAAEETVLPGIARLDALAEARIHSLAPELGGALDEAVCVDAAAELGLPFKSGAPWNASRELGIRESIHNIAARRGESPRVVAACLNSITVGKLHGCQASGDQAGAAKYGQALREIAPLLLEVSIG